MAARVIEAVDSPQVAEAFDAIAEGFNRDLENEITRRIRETVYRIIEELVKPGASILDINCGTGIDAISLARRGFEVTGIDISPMMIKQALTKIEKEPQRNVRFVNGSFGRLSKVFESPFDLVLSNFGGLNCTKDLSEVAKEIGKVVSPGGFFVGVVMPRFSLWESVSYLARGEWRNSLRRLKRSTTATGFRDKSFIVHYHSPSSFLSTFAPWFTINHLVGICVVSPSPQSGRFAQKHPVLSGLLVRIDSFVGELPFFRSIGDHYLIVLQRKLK